MNTPKPGLLAILEAKPGKESALAEFLNAGLEMVASEAGVETWYAFRITATSFGIYDIFSDDESRGAHLSGPLANALGEVADNLLAREPEIRELSLIAVKP